MIILTNRAAGSQPKDLLVKYQTTMETHSAPEASMMRTVISYGLSQVNQPISIEMPAECK